LRQPLEAIEQSALAEIDLVTKALGRLEAGTYGICTACGSASANKRLEAMPEAGLCISCAG